MVNEQLNIIEIKQNFVRKLLLDYLQNYFKGFQKEKTLIQRAFRQNTRICFMDRYMDLKIVSEQKKINFTSKYIYNK
ncbi:unnamed protein product [Paramecium sonneborni]|uniref:Uncharacterized protein n=1 Tax=Paramecium sonneborni TaxID=65129 RepID=A0A8S1MYH1_9CILI|nr:unnamed protein product [Paramecium sonneborni]